MVDMETCTKIQSFNEIDTAVFLKAGLHLWVGFFVEWTLQSCYIRRFTIPKIRLFNTTKPLTPPEIDLALPARATLNSKRIRLWLRYE